MKLLTFVVIFSIRQRSEVNPNSLVAFCTLLVINILIMHNMGSLKQKCDMGKLMEGFGWIV